MSLRAAKEHTDRVQTTQNEVEETDRVTQFRRQLLNHHREAATDFVQRLVTEVARAALLRQLFQTDLLVRGTHLTAELQAKHRSDLHQPANARSATSKRLQSTLNARQNERTPTSPGCRSDAKRSETDICTIDRQDTPPHTQESGTNATERA
jgi:hypothetical protein